MKRDPPPGFQAVDFWGSLCNALPQVIEQSLFLFNLLLLFSHFNCSMVVQTPQRALSWTTYLTTMNPIFWVCAVANVLLCAFGLYIITNLE